MSNKILDLLVKIPYDHSLYLIEEINENSGFFAENGKLFYLVWNIESLTHESIDTEFLTLNTNVNVTAVKNNQSFKDGYYNSIMFKGDMYDGNIESFIKLCSIYSQNAQEISFKKFFYSLINLFQFPKDQQFKNLLGLYGELKFIEYVYKELGFDISPQWHKDGSYSKYDFTCKMANFEVKTIQSEELIVTIKHNQLFNEDKNYLVVISAEKNNCGETVNQLIKKLQSAEKFCNNYNFNFNIEKEKKRISPIEVNTILFTVKDICIYYASAINMFSNIPESITNLKYSLDLSLKKSVAISQILEDI